MDDFTRFKIYFIGHFFFTNIDGGVVAAFGENIKEHGERVILLENRVFGIYLCTAGDGVAFNNGDELFVDEVADFFEDFFVVCLVII